MTFTPTPEQETIIEAARKSGDNLMVTALAGAAKTSTLVMIAEALPDEQILCLAFNKKIALEMTDRLPSNCTAKTLNGLGHSAWGQAIAPSLRLETRKVGNLLSEFIKNELKGEDASAAWNNFADFTRAIGFSKACGYVPNGLYEMGNRLMDDEMFFAHYEIAFNEFEQSLVAAIAGRSMKLAWKGVIDFDDQLLMPTVFSGQFPQFPLVMVDEAQDLSLLNHAMLKKIAKQRLIAVGDPCQAIYGFRGAHQDSMEFLQQAFDMKKLQLTISFRCPTAIVEEARWRAPEMQWPEWAAPGEVRRLVEWSSDDIPDGAAIICRNNAPLFNIGIKLLKGGRYPEFLGKDIGKGLTRIMRKFSKKDIPIDEVRVHIDDWKETQLEKVRNPGPVHDKADCMHIFCNNSGAQSLDEVIAYANNLMNRSGRVYLMTGHKSKGLEYETVFIMDEHLLRLDEDGQDDNLKYVMQTRSMDQLNYVTSETFLADIVEDAA